jgi:hypothetical protein
MPERKQPQKLQANTEGFSVSSANDASGVVRALQITRKHFGMREKVHEIFARHFRHDPPLHSVRT